MRSHHLLAMQLALLTSAAASLPPPVQAVWEVGAEPKPEPTRKRGKPTKAEKKAAKRARTRGVKGLDDGQA